MNRYTPMLLLGGLLMALIVFFALSQPERYSWKKNYSDTGIQPYDLKITKSIIDENFKVKSLEGRTDESLPRDGSAKDYVYMFINDEAFYTDDEAYAVKDFVQNGGHALIAVAVFPDSLFQYINGEEDCEQEVQIDEWGQVTGVRGRKMYSFYNTFQSHLIYNQFKHKQHNQKPYEFRYYENAAPAETYWSFISNKKFCDNRENPLAALSEILISKDSQYVNFARMRVGKGYLYIHTNPILFTNAFVVDSVGFTYVNEVLRHFSTDKQLLWDRESTSKKNVKKEKKRRRVKASISKSPLEYIYKQPALFWAWSIMLVLGALFTLFRAKRRQRKIPILETNKNTSIAFVESIANLYFQKKSHSNILEKQMQIFLGHIRERYLLNTNEESTKLIKRIAVRTKVNPTVVEAIFVKYQDYKGKAHRLAEKELMEFYKVIQSFHQAVEKNKFN